MSKSARNVGSSQDEASRRERIDCLNKVVNRKCLALQVRRRLLDRRRSPKCPAVSMVFFVIALWLYGDDAYPDVYRWLYRFSKKLMPSSSALTQARVKLGIAIMADTYSEVVRCLCGPQTPGAFYDGRRLVAVDGFVLDLPDSEANRKTFGRPKNGTSIGACPQARVVALCEVGSHVFFNFQVKPIRCGEATMAKHVYRGLPEKSLLFFDINFCSTELMTTVIESKSDFLGRCKWNRCFKKFEVLSDGTYLSKIYATDYDRVHDRNGTTVRVIEYTIDDPNRVGHQEKHRLLTTLVDEKAHPAEALIQLYHERWEEEVSIDEAKTHLRSKPNLRSESPQRVVQEIYGLLIAHFVIRKLAFEAAKRVEIAPRSISFTGTLRVLRTRLPESPRSRALHDEWYESTLEEVSQKVLEPRRNRINPRVIKRTQSKWPKKREKDRKLPQLTHKFDETIRLLT